MPNQNQWSVFKRLLTYLKPYKFLTFLALAFLLSTTVIKSIIPLVASYFIDHYLHDMNQAASLILIGYYGLYLLQTLVQYLGNLFFARVSYSIVRDIRRDAFANMDIAGYNYGIYRYGKDLKKYPKRLILGSETFCSDAYAFWEMAKTHPRIIGDFVWAGMDYMGEVGVGAWEYSDYAPDFSHGAGWITAGSGRIDLTGKPLAEAAYTKTAFELMEKPVIAVRPVNHTGEKHSPSAWKMSNAIESWSWDGCSGKKAQVEVYARADRVELFINGKSVGSKKMKNDCRTSFDVIYEEGIIEAISYDAQNWEIARNVLYTAGKETILTGIPEEKETEAKKLCFVRLQYTDKTGTVKPLKRGTLEVHVENGELLGLGNGCPYNERGYRTAKTDTYYGEALAVIRAGESGTVNVQVSDGKYACAVQIPVRNKEEVEEC